MSLLEIIATRHYSLLSLFLLFLHRQPGSRPMYRELNMFSTSFHAGYKQVQEENCLYKGPDRNLMGGAMTIIKVKWWLWKIATCYFPICCTALQATDSSVVMSESIPNGGCLIKALIVSAAVSCCLITLKRLLSMQLHILLNVPS